MKLLICIFLFVGPIAWGQEFFNFLNPDNSLTTLELEGNFLPYEKVEDGVDHTKVLYSSVSVNQRIYRDEINQVNVGARAQKLDLNGDSNLLRDFYNQQVSVSYRKALPGERFSLTSLSFGTASDRPFRNGRDSTISANSLYKFSSKWIGVVNYSNNRAFLNNIPLPGVFYIHELSRENSLIIGFPVIFWNKSLSDRWSFRYFGFIPWNHRMRLMYKLNEYLKLYAGFEQSPQTYFRHDRRSRNNRFFWFERRLALGAEGGLSRDIRYDLSSGLAFDRQFFEARNFSDEKEFLINANKSLFVAFNLRYTF